MGGKHSSHICSVGVTLLGPPTNNNLFIFYKKIKIHVDWCMWPFLFFYIRICVVWMGGKSSYNQAGPPNSPSGRRIMPSNGPSGAHPPRGVVSGGGAWVRPVWDIVCLWRQLQYIVSSKTIQTCLGDFFHKKYWFEMGAVRATRRNFSLQDNPHYRWLQETHLKFGEAFQVRSVYFITAVNIISFYFRHWRLLDFGKEKQMLQPTQEKESLQCEQTLPDQIPPSCPFGGSPSHVTH